MAGVMPTAAMVGSAAVGILAQDLDYVLVDMTFDLDLGSYRDGLGMMAIAARGSALANHRTEV